MLNLTEKGADVPAEPWSAPRGGVLRRLGRMTRPHAADAGSTLVELAVSTRCRP